MFDNSTGSSSTLLKSSITELTYTASSLIPGNTYIFTVKARNIYGLSVDSTSVSILAAQIPDSPTSLANVPSITTAY
jgi:hypothetical protein